MRIAYIANHGQDRSSDDEGAIAHALAVLGHDVTTIREESGADVLSWKYAPDLVLFHKWYDLETLTKLSGVCKTAVWYFDRVQDPDPKAQPSCRTRTARLRQVMPRVTHSFFTDGDWVANEKVPNSSVLRQGFDERLYFPPKHDLRANTVLFTGNNRWSAGRKAFVELLHAKFGKRLIHIDSGLYREGLRTLIQRSAVVVAPDSPGSDRYWSNRIYNVLGSGGCLLHPAWAGVSADYSPGVDFMGYLNRDAMVSTAFRLLNLPKLREETAQRGYLSTMNRNLYRHRVEQLLQTVTGATT